MSKKAIEKKKAPKKPRAARAAADANVTPVTRCCPRLDLRPGPSQAAVASENSYALIGSGVQIAALPLGD